MLTAFVSEFSPVQIYYFSYSVWSRMAQLPQVIPVCGKPQVLYNKSKRRSKVLLSTLGQVFCDAYSLHTRNEHVRCYKMLYYTLFWGVTAVRKSSSHSHLPFRHFCRFLILCKSAIILTSCGEITLLHFPM